MVSDTLKHDSYQQTYNAQAVVDAEGSQMVLATDVIRTPSDANQLEPALEGVTEAVGPVQRMLADGAMSTLRRLIEFRRRLIPT